MERNPASMSKSAQHNQAFLMQMRAKAVAQKSKTPEQLAAEKEAADERKRKQREEYEKEKAELAAKEEAEAKIKKEKEEAKAKEKKEQEEKENAEKKVREEADKAAQAAAPQQEESGSTTEAAVSDKPAVEPAGAPSPAKKAASAAVEMPFPMPDKAPAAKKDAPIRLRAIMNYEARNDKELSFEKGAIIYVPPQSDLKALALRGVFKGKAGGFPAMCVQDARNNETCGPTQAKAGVRCRAVGNYTAKNGNELSFVQGDVIYIALKTDEPMWKGVLKGQVGLVPRRMVLDMEEEKKLKETADKIKVLRCQAIKPHKVAGDGFLSFDYGDIVLVPKPNDSDTWEGVFKGNVGKFPADFVVDTSKYSKDQIQSMIEVERELASKAAPGGGFGDAFDVDQSTSDPWAATTTGGGAPTAGKGAALPMLQASAFENAFASPAPVPAAAAGGFDDDFGAAEAAPAAAAAAAPVAVAVVADDEVVDVTAAEESTEAAVAAVASEPPSQSESLSGSVTNLSGGGAEDSKLRKQKEKEAAKQKKLLQKQLKEEERRLKKVRKEAQKTARRGKKEGSNTSVSLDTGGTDDADTEA